MKTRLFIIILLIGCATLSCEDWLKETSGTEMSIDGQFESEDGFRDALTGVYLGMQEPKLYAMNLTWHFIEFISQQYAQISGMYNIYLLSYQYQQNRVVPYIDNIWQGQYNLIANINIMLLELEKRQDDVSPLFYKLMKGELLGLRAFFHFDLLRLYGYGDWSNRTDLDSRYTIPYVTKYTKDLTPQLSYTETFKLIEKDLAEALELLKEDYIYGAHADDNTYYTNVNGNHGFFTYYRNYRMNYYAVRALQARTWLWEGSPESKAKALAAAEEVIESDIWAWVNPRSLTNSNPDNRDMTFTNEHIFAIHVADLKDIIGVWFDASNPNATYERCFLTEKRAQTVYEADKVENELDIRYINLIERQGSGLRNYAPRKLFQSENNSNYGQRIPLIRVTEMFYIAAECLTTGPNKNYGKAIEYLNTVREKRNITQPLSSDLTESEIMNEITKEYMKEFVCEGQLFYHYKRLGFTEILGYIGTMTDKEYMLPYPVSEVTYGNRVQ